MEEWMKTTATVMVVMICWDIVRLYLQAKVNQWVLKKDFDEIDQALDDVEEKMEEDKEGLDNVKQR